MLAYLPFWMAVALAWEGQAHLGRRRAGFAVAVMSRLRTELAAGVLNLQLAELTAVV